MQNKNEAFKRLKAYRWPAFVVIVLVYMLAPFQRTAPAVMGPELMKDLGMNAVDFGLMGLALMWAYALAQAPMGAMLDRFGVRRGLTFILILAAAGSVAFGLAETFPLAVLGRVIVGTAMATFFLAGMKMISSWYSIKEYPGMCGIFMGLGAFGSVIATAPLQVMMNTFGWRYSFVLIGALSAALGILVYFLVKDQPSDVGLPSPDEMDGLVSPAAKADAPATDWRKTLKDICRQPNFLWLGLFLVGLNSTTGAIVLLWGGVFMADVYGFDKGTISQILTYSTIFMTLGGIAAGWTAKRVGHIGMMLSGTIMVLIVWLYMTINIRSLSALELTIILSAMSFGGFYASTGGYAIIRYWVTPAQIGTATGVANGVSWFLGAGAFQQAWGVIINYVSHGIRPYPAEAFQLAMWVQLVAVVASMVCAIYFWKISRTPKNTLNEAQ